MEEILAVFVVLKKKDMAGSIRRTNLGEPKNSHHKSKQIYRQLLGFTYVDGDGDYLLANEVYQGYPGRKNNSN